MKRPQTDHAETSSVYAKIVEMRDIVGDMSGVNRETLAELIFHLDCSIISAYRLLSEQQIALRASRRTKKKSSDAKLAGTPAKLSRAVH